MKRRIYLALLRLHAQLLRQRILLKVDMHDSYVVRALNEEAEIAALQEKLRRTNVQIAMHEDPAKLIAEAAWSSYR